MAKHKADGQRVELLALREDGNGVREGRPLGDLDREDRAVGAKRLQVENHGIGMNSKK
jgi:hypothetical protein